jgi:hypothetical protein
MWPPPWSLRERKDSKILSNHNPPSDDHVQKVEARLVAVLQGSLQQQQQQHLENTYGKTFKMAL